MFGQSGHIEAHTTQDIDLTELVSCPYAMDAVLNFLYTSQVQLNDKSVGENEFYFLIISIFLRRLCRC
jgi:hypothetical protein